ncbi:YqgE/AlgH family protein [Leptospira ellisii]|uniref:YqgE/AlgH family protein n=1 Tax=Leptospira ellisii TaxID=2023197 RepID=A0A2N0BPF6_9LEPT|nr:YqgE/AlgH family protein [Leptospira ellisii]MDV6234383.1 YqgE/AlgH family protein [Leptospira ellisii]PJZ92296.1 hypothetical protein CH379_13960 [Leptospira ellisii]PKA05861.1 hypothetical protein CH375_02755 [Leptospira ellisii]
MEESYNGKILISNSSIVMDYFNQTVILMVEHDKQGAFGLVLNKRQEAFIGDVIQGVPDHLSKNFPIYSGGPVDPTFISVLHENANMTQPGIEVIPGLFLARSFDTLLELMESASKFHVYQGYSGWGAGQLEAEMSRKSWVVHEASKDFVLNQDPETTWQEALRSKGGIYRYFVEHTKDPMLN